ncbi:hypothetical protein BH10PSE6_BH10PSE6_34160 [soil metagenome]
MSPGNRGYLGVERSDWPSEPSALRADLGIGTRSGAVEEQDAAVEQLIKKAAHSIFKRRTSFPCGQEGEAEAHFSFANRRREQ